MKLAAPPPIFRNAIALLLLAGAMLQPPQAFAAGWTLEQLMRSLALAQPGRATFVEKKTIAMLDRPLESSGELQYIAPDILEKRTVKPKPETMRVEGDVLTIQRGRQKFTLQLQNYPELAAFIDSIRGTLAGDRKALERAYKLKLEGNAERWLLSLAPTDAKMATQVHLIQISGNAGTVRSINVIQTDGDRSLLTIERIVQ